MNQQTGFCAPENPGNETSRTQFAGVKSGPPAFAWNNLLSREATLSTIYPWYLLVAAMDIMLTWLILLLGGTELNAVAVLALDKGGLNGLIVLKFTTVLMVIAICEYIAWKNLATARRLGTAAVAISTFPVIVAILELARSPLSLMN